GGAYIRRPAVSEGRRKCREGAAPDKSCEGVREPVLNGFTRLAVEASAASGELRVLGFEPARRFSARVTRATAILDVIVDRYGIRPGVADADIAPSCEAARADEWRWTLGPPGWMKRSSIIGWEALSDV